MKPRHQVVTFHIAPSFKPFSASAESSRSPLIIRPCVFQEFLELTVETDSEQPLPPPKEVARKLRSLAVQTVQSWQASYGTAYKKLALGYHFLKQVKKVRDVRQVQCNQDAAKCSSSAGKVCFGKESS